MSITTKVFFVSILLFFCENSLSQSQGSQDEIIHDIFERIGSTNQYYVELGFNALTHHGGSGSNTYALKSKGWHGLLLDGVNDNKEINLHAEMIFSSNIVQLMNKYNVPLEFDYLSIDNIWVFKALASTYRPRVVSIEFNNNYPPDSTIAFPDPAWMPNYGVIEAHQWNGGCYAGSSPGALYQAAHDHHYTVSLYT